MTAVYGINVRRDWDKKKAYGLLNVRSPIWTYQFLQHFSARSPRSDPIKY